MRARASGHSTTAVARPPTRLRCSPSKFHRSKAGPAATRASRPAPKRATPSETSGAISQREPIPYSTTATPWPSATKPVRSEEHTSELQSRLHLVCRLLLEKKNQQKQNKT